MLQRALPLVLLLAAAAPQEKKLPVPDAAAQTSARKLIRELFRDDFAQKDAQARSALLGKLLGQARQTNDDPAGRYVLFLEVLQLEAEARNLEGISAVVEELAALYAVDAAALKAEGMALMIKGLQTDVERSDAARQLLILAGDELELERLDSAQKAVDQAAALAKKVKDLPLAAKADAKGKEIAERRQRLEAIRQSRGVLAKTPDHPAANLAVGRYECFAKGNWEAGLPMLAKGSDAALRALAETDLKNPDSADGQAALGNSWWNLAEAEKDVAVKRRLRSRAAHWYEMAEPSASGQQKTLLTKRLAEIRGDRIQGNWIDFTDPRIFLLQGSKGEPIAPGLEGQPGRLVTLEKWPTGEYDGVSVRVRRGVPKTGASAALLFDAMYALLVEPGASVAAVLRMDRELKDWRREVVEKVENKDSYELMAVISGGAWLVYVDGKQILRVPTQRTLLSDVGLQVQQSVFSFDQFKLRKKN